MRYILRFFLIFLLFLMIAPALQAQFFRVYGYQTAEAKEKELVLWNTYIPSSDQEYDFFGESYERSGLMAHSLEVEYGLTNQLTVALYADFEQPMGGDFKFTGAKAVMFYYRLFDKMYLPVDLAIYGEYKFPRKGYKESEEIEFKLIMEKDMGMHRILLNPTFEKKVSGPDVTEGMEFILNGAYSYMGSLVFQPRLEYYSKYGEIREIKSWTEQKNYVFAGFDLSFGKYSQFMWHAGVGYPNHSTLSDPIEREGLTEGDRLYHSAFLYSEGEFTFAQWLCVEEIENRLDPLEERMENYKITLPVGLAPGPYILQAVLNYRRMPDPLADYFEIERRPVMEVGKDSRHITLQ